MSQASRQVEQSAEGQSLPTHLDAAAAEPVIELDAVGLVWQGRRPQAALCDVSLRVEDGERVAVIGASGCGKSTLLALVAGLTAPTSGRVSLRRSVALMPQRDLLVPWRTALDNAALALQAQGVSRGEARRRAQPLFERFGLKNFEETRTWELSGGMRQRIAFLRTVLTGREVLALDEPFGALDSITRAQMQQWLADALAADPRTLLLVTHDVEEALVLADRVLVLRGAPGTVTTELTLPARSGVTRDDWVTSLEFADLKAQALEALR